MEKIQKALEKAREQREDTGRPSIPHRSRAAHQRNLPIVPEEITYAQTRVVDTTESGLHDRRIIAGLTHHELSDTFRVLRTQVMKTLSASGFSTLGITSPNRGEGKTLTSVNLAISLAMHITRTVLLVDMDLRRPSVHTCFDITPEAGLADYLLGDVALSDCLVNPGMERLVILPAGGPLRSSSELIASPKMIGLAREVKSRYPDRVVIYDLPPVLTSDDTVGFLQHVECCLLVLQEGSTRKGDVQRTLNLLEGYNLIGTVLNKSSEMQQPYY
ncbi:MAG: CpsD/CapB family tyrosine-protein kinase [Rhodospirillales bacterium]|nr:CpsD/CapB family tyrosine-protein kinase [Rhodospirillales bacterium]